MHMRTNRTVGIIIAGALAATMVTATPALAEEGTSSYGEEDQAVASALGNLGEGLLQHPVGSQSPAQDNANPVMSDGYLDVIIPANARDGVSMTVGEFSLGISLPNAATSAPASTLENGAVAFASGGESSNAVVPTEGGVQLLSVIENKLASESYAYGLSIPAGHRLVATDEGGAQIIDAQGVTKVVFEPAWARDANGEAVPTHYIVEGTTLTQIVKHQELSDVAYPVVADPLPLVVIVVTTIAMIVVAAAVLGVATWIVVSWWNTCRAMGKYPELSTKNGFTARCVR